MGECLNLRCFPRSQGSSKIQHCQFLEYIKDFKSSSGRDYFLEFSFSLPCLNIDVVQLLCMMIDF